MYVLAFDTANEVIAIGVGIMNPESRSIALVASSEVAARRASNTQLLPRIDAVLAEHEIRREDIACVAVGRGPGSFTGVRIAMATAKGSASALGVGLIGVSSLDAVAWNVQAAGGRGPLVVVADAMRKEVYPVRYALDEEGVERLDSDRVVKAEDAARELARGGDSLHGCARQQNAARLLCGDALKKYGELFAGCGAALNPELWTPTGRGLLLALQAAWRVGEVDPLDAQRHDPAFVLPVYTRLSDAEENERIRLAKNDPKNLVAGVQDAAPRRDQRASMHDTAILNARPDTQGITYKPLDAAHVADVAALEARVMGSDAWSAALVADELPRGDRAWWAAYGVPTTCRPLEASGNEEIVEGSPLSGSSDEILLGYAGGWIVDGQVQILKVGCDPSARRHGIARGLLARVAADARDLGAQTCSLEVRVRNTGAQALYEALGLHVLGTRPHYYSDGEDALILEGPLPLAQHDVAGMELKVGETSEDARAVREKQADAPREASGETQASGMRPVPLILAIESSCDETAAALVDGNGALLADVGGFAGGFSRAFRRRGARDSQPQAHRGYLRRVATSALTWLPPRSPCPKLTWEEPRRRCGHICAGASWERSWWASHLPRALRGRRTSRSSACITLKGTYTPTRSARLTSRRRQWCRSCRGATPCSCM